MKDNEASVAPVDLNQAGVETLTTLPGIGPALAERIVRFREEVHPFEEAIEVTAVRGISEKMYHRLADRVTVSPVGKEMAVEPPPEESAPQADRAIEAETDIVALEKVKGPEQVTARAKPTAEEFTPEPSARAIAEETPVPLSESLFKAERKPEPKSSPPPSTPASRPAGIGFWRSLLLIVVGALAGALLALLVLQRINGTLDMASHPQVVRLADQAAALERQDETLNDEIRQLRSRLNQVEALSGRIQKAEADIQALNQAVSTLDEQVATLEQDNAQIREAVNQIQAATDRFDNFLDGLRDLLLTIQAGPTSAPTLTPPSLPSPTSGPGEGIEPVPSATELPAEPSAATATRTPRPTRTPTSTPTVTATPLPTFTPIPTVLIRTPSASERATGTLTPSPTSGL